MADDIQSRLGLANKYVNACPAQLTGVQRFEHGILVYYTATCGIEKECTGLHFGDGFGVDDGLAIGLRGDVQAHGIRCFEGFVQRDQWNVNADLLPSNVNRKCVRSGVLVYANHLHSTPEGVLRERLSDAAEAYNGKCHATQFAALAVRFFKALNCSPPSTGMRRLLSCKKRLKVKR